MQQRPPQPPKISLLDLLANGIESIELDGFKGKLIIRIEAVHIELHLSGAEPLESDDKSPNGQEGGE